MLYVGQDEIHEKCLARKRFALSPRFSSTFRLPCRCLLIQQFSLWRSTIFCAAWRRREVMTRTHGLRLLSSFSAQGVMENIFIRPFCLLTFFLGDISMPEVMTPWRWVIYSRGFLFVNISTKNYYWIQITSQIFSN